MSFFGLFGHPAKKRSHVPEYDSHLIRRFHHEHTRLVRRIGAIRQAMEEGPAGKRKVKRLLKSFKLEILEHFMEEDIKLYWYLKDRYEEDGDSLAIVRSFESSIKEMQKDIVHFFDYYSKEDVVLDGEYERKFRTVVDELAIRIASEEENLYPLYVT